MTLSRPVTRRLYLLRHGAIVPETPWRFLGQRDAALSDEGRAQSRRLRRMLAPIPFGRAWCSDLARCRETAAIVLSGRDVPLTPLAGLREISLGSWDGLTKEEARRDFPGMYEARGRDLADFRPPGGESFRDLEERAWAAVSIMLETGSEHMLAVAHAGVNRVLIRRVLDMPFDRLFSLGQDPGCLNILEFGDGPPLLRLCNMTA